MRCFVTGTVIVVQAGAIHADMDGLPVADFLALQNYNPAAVPEATYAFTFDLFSHAYGRVLAPAKIPGMDLADLEGCPWWEYKVCGYRGFWVARTDGRAIAGHPCPRRRARIR